MTAYAIVARPERCTGFRRCQLICTFHHRNTFTYDDACIAISEDETGVTAIAFTAACDRCVLCVRYCVYGTLRYQPGDAP